MISMGGMRLMTTKPSRFHADKYINDDEGFAILLDDAVETGDASYIAHALGVVARSRGMTQIAKEAGVTREALYKALSEIGDPKLSTLLGVVKALSLKLKFEPAGANDVATE
jgi:probable addiction module antidote protein